MITGYERFYPVSKMSAPNPFAVPEDRILPLDANGRLVLELPAEAVSVDPSAHPSCAGSYKVSAKIPVTGWRPIHFGYNPRRTDPKSSRVKAMRASLLGVDGGPKGSFCERNRGIRLIADKAVYDPATRTLRIEMNHKALDAVGNNVQGLMDGAHTQYAIVDVQESPSELPPQFVTVNVHCGIGPVEAQAIAVDNQTQTLVDQRSFENLRGSYEAIKASVSKKVWANGVVYTQGPRSKVVGPRVDIQFLVMLLDLMDWRVPLGEGKGMHKVESATRILANYHLRVADHAPYVHMLPSFVTLWDVIERGGALRFNEYSRDVMGPAVDRKTPKLAQSASRVMVHDPRLDGVKLNARTLTIEGMKRPSTVPRIDVQRALFSCFRALIVQDDDGYCRWADGNCARRTDRRPPLGGERVSPPLDLLVAVHGRVLYEVEAECVELEIKPEQMRRSPLLFRMVEKAFLAAKADWEGSARKGSPAAVLPVAATAPEAGVSRAVPEAAPVFTQAETIVSEPVAASSMPKEATVAPVVTPMTADAMRVDAAPVSERKAVPDGLLARPAGYVMLAHARPDVYTVGVAQRLKARADYVARKLECTDVELVCTFDDCTELFELTVRAAAGADGPELPITPLTAEVVYFLRGLAAVQEAKGNPLTEAEILSRLDRKFPPAALVEKIDEDED